MVDAREHEFNKAKEATCYLSEEDQDGKVSCAYGVGDFEKWEPRQCLDRMIEVWI